MNAPLTGIARDVVADFLFSEKPPLELHTASGARTDREPLTLSSAQYAAVSNRLLFFPFAAVPENFFEAARIDVRFFYKGRGVRFFGEPKRVKNGFALIVPQTILKSDDVPPVYLKDISASIYIPGFTSAQARCRLADGFEPFNNRQWLCFSKKEALRSQGFFETVSSLRSVELPPLCRAVVDRTKRILYLPGKKIPLRNFFPFPVSVTAEDIAEDEKSRIEAEVSALPYDVYIPLAPGDRHSVHTVLAFKSYKPTISPVDIEEKLLLLPVCRFLAMPHKDGGAIWHRLQPLSILSLNHSSLILGGSGFSHGTGSSFAGAGFPGAAESRGMPFPLSEGGEYRIRIRIFIGPVCRVLDATFFVSKLYKNGEGALCALCSFLRIQEEDRRFLYEKYYGVLYK